MPHYSLYETAQYDVVNAIANEENILKRGDFKYICMAFYLAVKIGGINNSNWPATENGRPLTDDGACADAARR